MIFDELKPGRSVEQQEIRAFSNHIRADRYCYLISGVHGDEVEGIYICQQIFNWLQQSEMATTIPLIVIPIVNVDGHRAGIRTNARGVDLNRNLPTADWQSLASEPQFYPGSAAGSEPETQYLLKLFEKYPPLFMMSLHSWKPMINYNGNCHEIANYLSAFNGYPPVASIGYPTPGSMGTYLPEQWKAPVITFEAPRLGGDKGLHSIWQENQDAFVNLFSTNTLAHYLAKLQQSSKQ